jgi:hypothetical protein
MAYVAQCLAGFAMPLRAGKFDVIGVRATISDTSKAARLTLFDDSTLDSLNKGDRYGKGYSGTDPVAKPATLFDMYAAASALDGILRIDFTDEPITVRNGISATNAYNLVGGSVCLYIK